MSAKLDETVMATRVARRFFLDDRFVRLQNGWVAKLAASVDRSCSQQTGSLAEFVRRFGPASTTVIDLSKQRITIVKCSADVKASG